MTLLVNKKAVEHEVDSVIVAGAFGTVPLGFERRAGRIRNQEESRPSRLQHC